eukprot:4588608-Lingulodinium_polyedra.AAC.1
MARERSARLGGRKPNAAPFSSIHLAASLPASVSLPRVALFRSFHPSWCSAGMHRKITPTRLS